MTLNRRYLALLLPMSAACAFEPVEGGPEVGSSAAALIGPVVQVTAGRHHSCALDADGLAWCAGRDLDGQLGDAGSGYEFEPSQVLRITGVAQIEAGFVHTCARLDAGTVYCWGKNAQGQVGDGTQTNRPLPVRVPGIGNAVDISANGAVPIGPTVEQGHTCVVRATGRVSCWGANLYGQLGDGTTERRLSPTFVSGQQNAVAVATGGRHTCALRNDGIVRCWGTGRLGDGTTGTHLTPVRVLGLSDVVAIDAGRDQTCGLQADGDLYCWGSYGTQSHGALPELVATGAVSVGCGDSHLCWSLASGESYCKGQDVYGQLGNGPLPSSAFPQLVEGAAAIIQLGTGESHNLGLTADGTVYGWGRNDSGQLADGTDVDADLAVTSLFGVPTP